MREMMAFGGIGANQAQSKASVKAIVDVRGKIKMK